jgi:16S rRNA (adenine1518-N6/adenine1519-N6)-dimethyltransferase
MIEPAFYPKLCEYACVAVADVVLDAGAGFGFFTCFLAGKSKTVVAVEKDPRIAVALREQVKDCANVTVVQGDVLTADLPTFTKVVAIPPYYLSSRLVTWLLERKTPCAVLVLQKEFADKLVAPVGSENYSWLTVLTSHEAEVEVLDSVPKSMFYPQPEVDSAIVRLTRWEKPPFTVKDEAFFNRLVRWVFTQRNKKICNALVPFLKNTRKISKEDAENLASTAPFHDRRARDLSPKELGKLANYLEQ